MIQTRIGNTDQDTGKKLAKIYKLNKFSAFQKDFLPKGRFYYFMNYYRVPVIKDISMENSTFSDDLFWPESESGSEWILIGKAPRILTRIEVKSWIRIRIETHADP
jgi:hypothetical protein